MTRLQYQKGSNLTNIATADSPTGSGSKSLSVGNMQYNGSSFDAERNNLQGALLASLARTAGINTPNQTNYNAKGVILFFYITVAGTTGLTLYYGYTDPVSGTQYEYAAPQRTATGLSTFVIYPNAQASAGTTVVNAPVPRTWYARVQAGDGSSWTYSLGYSLIL